MNQLRLTPSLGFSEIGGFIHDEEFHSQKRT